MTQKLGIIQSRGLGDILIALPIAHYYYKQGWEIHWPICKEFYDSVKESASWVNWSSLETDKQGYFFYSSPLAYLQNRQCDEIICLYQSLNVVPELSAVPWFQIQHFDEFKYTKANVPFLEKWNLSDCITRNLDREQALFNKLVKNSNYYVTQFKGSTFVATPDLSAIPEDWQRIDVDENITDNIFDWLTIVERSTALICIDSALSNLVDMLKLEVSDKYWIPRSHIHLTPVLGTSWTILDPPVNSTAAQKIFSSVL